MKSFSRTLSTITLCVACVSDPSQDPGAIGGVVVTTTETYELEPGPGAEICAGIDEVHKSLAGNRLLEARASVNYLLSEFRRFEAPSKTVLSFGSENEYRSYLDISNNPEAIVPVDWCYRELFQLKAFISASQEEYDEALLLLAKSSEVGPTAAAPYVERGYIFNRLGRFGDARESYEKAIQLVNKYPISRPQYPMALRGLGFALVELGDLDGAESAFTRSLEVDPDNDLAKRELQYIRKLRR